MRETAEARVGAGSPEELRRANQRDGTSQSPARSDTSLGQMRRWIPYILREAGKTGT